MWIVESEQPFRTGRCFLQDKDGKLNWIVVIKGTYDIHPDENVSLSKKQEPVHEAPVYRGEEGKSSLLYDTDLVLFKPLTDVLVNGSAHAPMPQTVRSIDVTLKLTSIRKTLRVTGDRYWMKSLFGVTMTKPIPFAEKEIVYENAFGGGYPDPDRPGRMIYHGANPVGTGFFLNKSGLSGKPVPGVENPGDRKNKEAGFGAVPCQWAPRYGLAGTYDDAWMKERMPFLPADYDPLFNQCAPIDQQVKRLNGGELVELTHMTPLKHFSFRLPEQRFSCVTTFTDGDVPHEPVLNTVVIEPDHPRVVMVWHTHVECHGKEDRLMKTTVIPAPTSAHDGGTP
jgi:hypothetical protein